MNTDNVIDLKPYRDYRRMADAKTYEQKLAAAQAIFKAAQADLKTANGAIAAAELDSHDCRIIRAKVGLVEHITTECCYDESGCAAGAGAGPLLPALAQRQAG